MHLRVKKLNLDIFAHAVQAKLSHRFKHHPSPPPRQKEITHSPKKPFFSKIYPPIRKVVGGNFVTSQQQ